jgi:hypothetical protein
MKKLRKIYGLPISFVLFIYQIYVMYMVIRNTNPVDLDEIESNEDLNKMLNPFVETFYNNNKTLLHIFSIICWVLFLKAIL